MSRWAGVNVAAELRCELKARHAGSRPAPSPGEEGRGQRETADWWLWQVRVKGRACEGARDRQ